MDIDKFNTNANANTDRRTKTECLKLDTFANINMSLTEIKLKLDDIGEEMRTMIKLEQQVLTQSKDIERLSATVDVLRTENQQLNNRVMELRTNFENQKQSIGTFERVGWAVATAAAIFIGKQFGIS